MTQPSQLTVEGVNLVAILPESVLAAGGLLILVAGAGLGRRHRALITAASIVIFAAAAAAAIPGAGKSVLAYDSTVALDGFATFFKIVLAAVGGLGLLASYHFLDAEGGPATEYCGLMLLSTAGMMLMASATDLILIFLALETFSLGFYVMAAYRRGRLDSQEAALKYFLTGSFSSAFFLYGIALIYGGTGTTRLFGIASRLEPDALEGLLVPAGLALVVVGLAFKVAAVPFHMWTPDAYEGAPAPVSGFMAAGSKIAGFAVLLRVMVATFPSIAENWQPIVAGLAVVTMIVGTVVAVAQTNVKRMLAYSSIAHSGFLLLGVAAGNARGVSGSIFYLAVYAVVIIGAFAVAYAVGRPGEEHVHLDDYRGLWSRRPFLAGVFALLLVSLAGIPPTAGFWAKVEVFSAAASAGFVPLVVIAFLASAVAAFFYLRVIALMFLEETAEWGAQPVSTAPTLGLALLVTSAVVVVVGIIPTPLLDFARQSTLVFR